MHVDVADALAMKDVTFDERENLFSLGDHDGWQVISSSRIDERSLRPPARDLADDEWMHEDGTTFQQIGELRN
ncbi:MAG: hypothetical protein JF606_02565 [Burkholderiales bacterium]|nr:hypothetical protein [Burkholderiales bacterium]